MIRVLVAAGSAFAAAAATEAAFEPPYSIALSGLRSELESCARVSGFDFRGPSRPTVPQLSRMCDNTACIAILNQLLSVLQIDSNDVPTATSNAAAFTAFGLNMLNYCWFFRSPGDPCPESPHYDVASRLAVWDDTCRNQTNYSFQFKDKSSDLEVFRRTSVAVSHYLKLCTIPECMDVLIRMDYLTLVDPCVNFRAVGPNDMKQSEVAGVFDSQCRGRYPHLYPKQPGYYFQRGPSLPLNLSDPVTPAPPEPPTEEPKPTNPALSSSSSSADAGSGDNGSLDATPDPTTETPSTGRVADTPAPTPSEDEEKYSQDPPSSSSLPSSSSSALPASSADTDMSTASSSDAMAAPAAIPLVSPSATAKRISTTTTSSSPPLPSVNAGESAQSASSSLVPIVGSVAGVVLLMSIAIVYHRRRMLQKDGIGDYQHLQSPATFDGAPSLDPVVAALAIASNVSITHKRVPIECLEDIRLIGTGGNGVVYLVRDARSDRLLASKRLAKRQQTKEKIDDFVTEIQLVSTLDHPCIVSFVGASWTNRTDIQALFEYMQGGDLRTHLESTSDQLGVWSTDKLQIALDVAEALVYVHATVVPAVVHRDIKSRNVLLSSGPQLEQNPSQRRAKLTDFGVAREQSSNHTMTTGIGTSRWLAPEVIVGGGAYDSACDIYSFGIVLSELDTHRVPFSDFNTPGQAMSEVTILTMIAIEQVKPTFSGSCPEALLVLAKECMCYDPKKRPTAQEVVARLREARSQVEE